MDYYNEHDAFAAAWLRQLIAAGELPPGDVDERSIEDVIPADLVGYRHCHWFAGIGGWAYALRLADWPDDAPVWTGSCPCQPFSAAGQGKGLADKRHLWPAWFWLIQQCQPCTLVGEQVASADALDWWDLVATDLEGAGYAVAAVDLPAAGVEAPHKRNRLFWVADAGHDGRLRGGGSERDGAAAGQPHACGHQPDGCGDAGEWLGDTRGAGSAEQRRRRDESSRLATASGAGSVGDTSGAGLPERERVGRLQRGPLGARTGQAAERRSDPDDHPWSALVWLPCADGKARPTQPGLQPLAHGVPARVGRLRGYGNAIVPQVAAAFLRAVLDGPLTPRRAQA